VRRWNGWGDEAVTYPLPTGAKRYLEGALGEGCAAPDADFERLLRAVPEARLPKHPSIETDPEARLRHARGQSLPDWIALRSGQIEAFPDGVAFPAHEEHVRPLFRYAAETGAALIPYGGGTSVVGHINPLLDDRPSVSVDMRRLCTLFDLNHDARLATFGAGAQGPQIEAELNAQGFTLGHFPQSWEQSTLGGWIATRSSGQQSLRYGRIEGLFAGGHIETPSGALFLPPLPASAAGPDLREMILGSEGRFGVITHAAVRIRALPEVEKFYGAFFHDWESGVRAVREILQADLHPSMLRLSDPLETETTLTLSGRDRLVAWAERGLRLLGYGPERCLLIYGITGDRRATSFTRRGLHCAIREHGGLPTGTTIGEQWRQSRFRTPYLRNTLWEHGYATDTLETAVPWSSVLRTARAVLESLRTRLSDEGERVLAFAHLSHVYQDGASIYVTFLFRRSSNILERWRKLKAAASGVIVSHGGTISHQHGVGLDHAPYLRAEKGQAGMAALEAARACFDPQGLLNPGKLLNHPSPIPQQRPLSPSTR
jgi:alkyldihydroxyacetonephosphate synthase